MRCSSVPNDKCHLNEMKYYCGRYRGVSTHKQSGKWVAQIKSGGKQVYLGFYNDQVDAARAYDQAVIHMQASQSSVLPFWNLPAHFV